MIRNALGIALAAALVSFDPGDAAAQQAETWQLSQVNGSALPTVVEQDDDGCRDEIVSGTLTLGADGDWKLVTNEREVCGTEVEEETNEEDGRYTVRDDGIHFGDDDGDDEDDADDDSDGDIDVDELAHGTRSGSTLTVRSADGSTTLVFAR